MTPPDIVQMLDRDRGAWEALVSALDARPHEVLHDPESPAWTAKEVYAHLARWMEHSTDDFEAHIEGKRAPRDEGTDDEINERWAVEDRALTFDEARRRAHEAYERRLRTIQALPDEQWDHVFRAIARSDGHEHYAAHSSYLT
jgi:hypothetical protein